MAKLTPQEFQEKHARRLKEALEDIRRGIDRVQENPCEKAADAQQKMRTNLLAAIDNGKWAAGLRRVSLQEWKTRARDIGVGRISAGIDAAKDKVTAFASELLPHIDQGLEQLKGLPDITLEDNINRMTTFIRHMAGFRRGF